MGHVLRLARQRKDPGHLYQRTAKDQEGSYLKKGWDTLFG